MWGVTLRPASTTTPGRLPGTRAGSVTMTSASRSRSRPPSAALPSAARPSAVSVWGVSTSRSAEWSLQEGH